MLDSRSGLTQRAVEPDILRRRPAVRHHLQQPDGYAGRHHVAGNAAHLLGRVTADRLGRDLEMHRGNGGAEFLQRLTIQTGIENMLLIGVPNMQMHRLRASCGAGQRRLDRFLDGDRDRRMVSLGAARAVWRDHQARQVFRFVKIHGCRLTLTWTETRYQLR